MNKQHQRIASQNAAREIERQAQEARMERENRANPRITVWQKIGGAFGAHIYAPDASATTEFAAGDTLAERLIDLIGRNHTEGQVDQGGMTMRLHPAQARQLIALANAQGVQS